MNKKRIIIIGAGLTGLTLARELQNKKLDYIIFEKEKGAGGLCRSKKINNFIFDFDGHLLHFKNHSVFKLIKNLLKNNMIRHKRNAFIYYKGKYIPYPFQANLYRLPICVKNECLSGFINAGKNKQAKNNDNFLNWINNTLGGGIAKHFMIPYNRKFWSTPLENISCEWLDNYILVPSLTQIISGAIKENNKEYGYNTVFWYPKTGGINCVQQALSRGIKHIKTNSRVTEINLIKKQIKTASGDIEKFDYIVNTAPLPELSHLIKDIPPAIRAAFDKLKWNSIFNLNIGIDRKACLGNKHWVYFPQKDISFFRVGFYHNFSSNIAPNGKMSLYAEAALSGHFSINRPALTGRVKKDLQKIGILYKNDKICAEDANEIKYGYPIYDHNYSASRKIILNFLKKNDIISRGRYGAWKYMSMEDAVCEGLSASKLFT